MSIYFIIYLLFVHWLADFVLQSYYIALKKSKSNKILCKHCAIYGMLFVIATLNFEFGLMLGLLHFPIDYVTSRLNAGLYKKKRMHEFFVSIGFDQWIHFSIILLLGRALL